jgi:hypothetical protein
MQSCRGLTFSDVGRLSSSHLFLTSQNIHGAALAAPYFIKYATHQKLTTPPAGSDREAKR